jgi:hypothetical protein
VLEAFKLDSTSTNYDNNKYSASGYHEAHYPHQVAAAAKAAPGQAKGPFKAAPSWIKTPPAATPKYAFQA